ncbi:MAG TPA: hypothetical protein VK670_14895 [Silvibacterium sp.]|nr:hypothetical protein [Silvibacterium sp.]
MKTQINFFHGPSRRGPSQPLGSLGRISAHRVHYFERNWWQRFVGEDDPQAGIGGLIGDSPQQIADFGSFG